MGYFVFDMIINRKEIERQIIELVATDRIYIPISSMSGKLERKRPNLARAIEFPKSGFIGERVFARIEVEDKARARTLSMAVKKYCEDHKKEGEELTQYIEDERAGSETYFCFGMREGCILTQEDYMGVMRNLKFTETESKNLYPQLMVISRKMVRKRKELERSVLIGSDFPD